MKGAGHGWGRGRRKLYDQDDDDDVIWETARVVQWQSAEAIS